MSTVGRRVVDGLVSAYQRHVSAGLNAENDSHCLYTPSCSAYAREAIEHGGAFDGAIDAMGRLARCNGTFAERNREALLAALDDPAARVEVADDGARAVMQGVRDALDAAVALRTGGRPDEAREAEATARRELREHLHVGLEDRPGQHDTKHFTVSLEHRPSDAACAHGTPSHGPRRGFGAFARSVAGTIVGGALGAVLGGLGEGLLTGLVLAPLAATGRSDKIAQWLTPRAGNDGAEALTALAARATLPASATRRVLGAGPLASAAALAVGVPLGLLQGVVHGALFGASWGARVGRAL